MAAGIEVKLKAPDGTWETVGVDRYPGVEPESPVLSTNESGFDTCSFVLRRPTDQLHADLAAWTPCEVWVAGVFVWEGRVRETPTTEGDDPQISVSGIGWQAQWDDDLVRRCYTQTDMSAWKDTRQYLGTDLAQFPAAPQVNADGGAIVLMWPNGSAFVNQTLIGATIDLGPDPARWAMGVTATMARFGSQGATWYFKCKGHDAESGAGPGPSLPTIEEAWSVANPGNGDYYGSFTYPHRYVSFLLYTDAAATMAAEDRGWKITAACAYADGRYQSGRQSILRASDVIADAAAAPGMLAPTVSSPRFRTEALGVPALGGFYELLDQSGTYAADSSGNQYPGSFSGVLTFAQAGLLTDPAESDLSIQFNGGYIAFPTAVLTGAVNNVTDVSAFVLAKAPASWSAAVNMIVFIGNSATNGFGIYVDNLGHLFFYRGGIGGADTGYVWAAAATHFVAVTRDTNGLVQVWVDGTVVYSVTPTINGGATSIQVGANGAGGQTWPGRVGKIIFAARAHQNTSLMAALWQAALARQTGTVQRTGLNIPDFAPEGYKTRRELLDASNALHRYRLRCTRGPQTEFGPMPSTPLFKVGDWPGSRFVDASSGSGEEVYNRALVTGQDGAGNDLIIERTSGHQPGAVFGNLPSTPQLANPSFATDLSNWTAEDGTIARDATVFDTSPASLQATSSVAKTARVVGSVVTKPLVAGRRYRLRLRLRWAVAPIDLEIAAFRDGPVAQTNQNRRLTDNATVGATSSDFISAQYPGLTGLSSGTWYTFERDFTAQDATMRIMVRTAAAAAATGVLFNVDSVEILDNLTTVVDRQTGPTGRPLVHTKEIPISSVLTPAIGQAIADVFLQLHQRTPLKGTLELSVGGLRKLLGDEDVHPSETLLNGGEMIRFTNRVDPDTGGEGRDGVIAGVSYEHAAETGTVQIDNDRGSFDALLQRMQVVQGTSPT